MATHAVTGATSFTGRYIAQRLAAEGHDVRDLTRARREPHPLGERVVSFALDFEDPALLTA